MGRAHAKGVSHVCRTSDIPKGKSSFTFCTNLKDAVEAAKRQANKKDVMVHGASTTQQLLTAGLADELRLHVAPLLLGGGRRLFERSADDEIGRAHV